MSLPVKIKLWEEDVAAIVWDDNREIAVVEFYETFSRNGWDIAPFTHAPGRYYAGIPGLYIPGIEK